MTAATPAPVFAGPVWDTIRAALVSLHPGQRRVAEVLLSLNPQELARSSASEVAELSGTSPATVVRTCQQLGFRGFRECAMLLALETGIAVGTDVPDDDEQAPKPSVRFLRDAAAALTHAASALDDDLLAKAGAELAAARRLLVVAYGWSQGAVANLAINLAAIGRSVESPVDAQQQVVAAANLDPGDVCLVVCYTGSHRHAQLVAKVAHERGACVVLVTTFSKSLAAAHADLNLVFGGRDAGDQLREMPTAQVVQFATLEALRLRVVEALGISSHEALNTSMAALVAEGLTEDR